MKSTKTALITGVTGQDGAYLSELLLAKSYEVHGLKRRSSLFNTDRIDHLYQDPHVDHQRFQLHYGDLTDGTSELYGLVQETPQKETTPFDPRGPYAVAKLYGNWITVNYREAYGLYACNGILFNHESPLRGETFVTRKITRVIARIALGLQDCLYLGNLSALRDWGHARDYVQMQWLMLQQDQAEDFVIATGVQYSVRQFVEFAAAELGDHAEVQRPGRPGRRRRHQGRRQQGQVQGGRRGRQGRSALLPAHRGRNFAGRPEQGQAGVGAHDHVRRTGERDGGVRLHCRAARRLGEDGWIPGV